MRYLSSGDVKAHDIAAPQDVEAARKRIEGVAHQTPVVTCKTIDGMAGRSLFFKCENFQKTGSFKFRGALNAVSHLLERGKGETPRVVTQSSGNHGQALAACAQVRGVPATVVMPRTSPAVKKAAVRGYGAEVVECEPTEQARDLAAAEVLEKEGGVLIHPNQDPDVIAGQGTIAMELLEQVSDLDAIVAPVGGGGMVGGIAVWAKHKNPQIKVIAAEPIAADDCARSKREGVRLMNESPPDTVADGVKVSIGENTWPIIRDLVDDVVCVSETDIMAATRLVWERMKLVIEPSSGVGVAAVLSPDGKRVLDGCERVAVVLCGGNVDLAKLEWADETPTWEESG
uniref:Tryptophan synthase beta chain-like PALP domain-containing protein n=1 Tax=Lotharella oceanica TaxID=641309 RepID=A0A7S2TUA6_9EUKA